MSETAMDYRQLTWAIAHDPCKEGDRMPLGPVTSGTEITLTLRIDEHSRSSVKDARLLIGTPSLGDPNVLVWVSRVMHQGYAGYHATFFARNHPHVLFYVFAIALEDGRRAYCIPHQDGRSSAGELVIDGVGGTWTNGGWIADDAEDDTASSPEAAGAFLIAGPTPGFQVTVYDAGFSTPPWLEGAIMYHLFPDRFARGSSGVNTAGLSYHERMKRPVRLHECWDDPVEWEGPDDGVYDPIDFFGGTLEGIRERLGYLASLGVEVLYMNPIFEARSNHRYDTADYEQIDPLLGSTDDFRALCSEAERAGISIVLDAVLSHTGADSRYFDAQGTYGHAGALRDPDSPYRPWYDFDHPSENASYRCWWGFPSLPEVDERNESWQQYMLGETGILPRWLAAGARGYRLDVADEIPDSVLEHIRRSIKDAKPDAAIIGEVWEDPTVKVSYGSWRTYALGRALDSVMNYPLRDALLGFATNTVDALQLATFLKQQQANYPTPLYRCLMNLLSSHDVERMRSVLALGSGIKHLPRNEQLAAVSNITGEQDERAARLQRMVVGILYALPGAPCIYYGDERGLQGGGDPFCRNTLPVNDDSARKRPDCGRDLTRYYQDIGQVRKNTPTLKSGDLWCCAPSTEVICIVRASRDGNDLVLAVANRSTSAHDAAFDLQALGVRYPNSTRSLTTVFGEGSARIEHGIAQFTIGPCSTAYFE